MLKDKLLSDVISYNTKRESLTSTVSSLVCNIEKCAKCLCDSHKRDCHLTQSNHAYFVLEISRLYRQFRSRKIQDVKVFQFNTKLFVNLLLFQLNSKRFNKKISFTLYPAHSRVGSVKTLRSPLSAEFRRHCVLSGRTQRRAPPRHQSEEMEI